MPEFNNLDIYDVDTRNSRIRDMAIKIVYSNVVTRRGDLIYDEDEKLISMDEALVKIEYEKLQALYISQEYSRSRKSEYPSIGDQLDMIYHSGLGGPEFQAAIKAVKDAHPKGGN